MNIQLDDLINVTTKDRQVQIKVKDILDNYNRLTYDYQSKIGYDTLSQIVIPKELINMMGTTIVDIDIELKMEINRTKNLESKLL